jgi:hypothetical protein
MEVVHAAPPPHVKRVAEEAVTLAGAVGWSEEARARIVEILRPLQIDQAAVAALLERPSDERWIDVAMGGSSVGHASLFAIRRGEAIPLHDHPGMTVICKVLRGRLQLRTLEWSDRGALLAHDLGLREVGEGDEPVVLEADPGALHHVTALTDCAFLDLFAPYYDGERPCTYYRIAGSRSDAVVQLEVIGEATP